MAKKARKWSNTGLQEEPVELSERELKIRAATAERDAKTLKDLAEEYLGLIEEEEFEELAQKARSITYEALDRRIRTELVKVKDLSGHDTWRGEGMTFSPKTLLIPVVKDKKALRDWVKASGREDMMEIGAPKLKSIVVDAMNTDDAADMTPGERAKLKAGEPASGAPPPGVEVYTRPGVNATRIRRKSPSR